MVPSLDLQLQAALKAMSDTVVPAIDPADKMATEQVHLVVATIQMVRERLPVQRRFIRRLLEDAIALAEQMGMSEEDSALAEAAVAARSALGDPELEAHELEAVRTNLTSVIVRLIAGAGGEGLDRFGSIVAKGCRTPLDRLRAWSAISGFEPDALAVKSLNSVL